MVNDGLIAASVAVYGGGMVGVGVAMRSGGSVTNAASSSVTGAQYGITIAGAAGIVVNDGSIIGGLDDGVSLLDGGTLTNAGTVIGNNGTAAAFDGTGSNLLVLDPGFGFSGIVAGSASASNTLELASAASAGTVTGLGANFLHFGPITFDPGAEWSITGIQRGLAGAISGFTVGDTIVMTGVTATGSSFTSGILTIDEGGGGSATLDLPGVFTLANFDVTPGVSGATEVTFVPCFRAGTHIQTESGEVTVERLTPDDVVVTRSGRLRPVRWIGHRRIWLAFHPKPQDVYPVRVQAHAFGPGLPHRDLSVSPDHALFLDGVLIPARNLCNGATIRQEPMDAVEYFHVELERHDVLLAEGMHCESYLDTGNRTAFANGADEATLRLVGQRAAVVAPLSTR